MKKVLCVFLCLLMAISLIPAGLIFAAETYEAAEGVTIGRPEGSTILITHTTEDGYYKKLGETPWGFEHAPVGTDKYENLEYIQTGWYYESYQNWVQGAVQHPISMHAGMGADPIVSFTCPSDGTLMIHESYCGDLGDEYKGDGVQFMITKNSKNIYPKEGWIQVLDKNNVKIPNLTFEVKKGDVIRFRLNCIETQQQDGIHWTKKISYLGSAADVKPVEGVTFGQPEDMTILATHTAADGYAAPKGSTPWGFEHAPVNTDNYEHLEYINNGWYYETYQNWSQGAIQHAISMHAGVIADPVVSFTCPSDGTMMIHKSYCGDLGENYSGDGVQFKILLNDQQLYPSVGWVQVLDKNNAEIPDLVFKVKKGDVIRFRLNCIATQQADGIHWTKTLSYLTPANAVEPASGVISPIPETSVLGKSTKSSEAFESNEGTDWVYQNVAIGGHEYSALQRYSNAAQTSFGWFSGAYQNWSAGAIPYVGYLHPGMAGDSAFTYVCPQDGTLAILPNVIKVDQSSYDGCKVAILKNDANVYPAIGMIEIKPGRNLDLPGMTLSVKKGDQIHFRANINASQSSECARWNPEVAYVTGQGAVEEKAIFEDLKDHWAREAVEELFEKNIVKGKAEGVFDPEAQVTRAEFLTMVQKAAKLPSFNFKQYYEDVPMDAWFTATVTSAYAYDLIADELTPDGKLNPDAPILREEMTSIMVDAMQNQDYRALESGDLSMFNDAANCAEWVKPSIAQSVNLGLIKGNPDGTFAPKATATRAEAAVIIQRFLNAANTREEGAISLTYNQPYYTQVDIQKMITDAYNSGAKEVVLPAGAYLVPYRNAGHIKLSNMKDFAIKGQNTTLVFENLNATGIAISGCENLTITGINTDHKGYGFYQGEITAVDPECRYVDIKLDPAYPHHWLDKNEFFERIDARFYTPDAVLLHNLDDRGQIASYEKIGQYRYRCYLLKTETGKMLQVGYLLGERSKIGSGISLTTSKNVNFKDCNIYTGITGVSETRTEGGSTYTNVGFVPGPKPEGAKHERLFSITGTGYYAQMVRKGAVMDNIKIIKNNDDGINVHGLYSRVAEQIDAKTVIVATEDNAAVWYGVGDLVRFADTTNSQVGEARVVASERLSGYKPSTNLNYDDRFVSFDANYFFKLTLDKAVQVEPSYIAEDVTLASDGMVIKNSYFAWNAPRTMIMHANNAVIENNTFENVPRYAIFFRPEIDWGESGYTQNTVIRNNKFINCGFSKPEGSAICFDGDAGYDHKNITIEGNTFQGSYRTDLLIECATNLVVRNNTFGAPNTDYSVTPSVKLDKCNGVTFSGNTFPSDTRKVSSTDTVKGIVGLE